MFICEGNTNKPHDFQLKLFAVPAFGETAILDDSDGKFV